jgi:heptosyltransferase-1
MSARPRILIVKLSSLGDLFHALPAVAELQRIYGADIDWVTQPEFCGLVQQFTPVSEVICFPRKHFRSQGRAFFDRLRREKYDFVIDLQGILKSAAVTRAAIGKRKILPSFAREGTRLFFECAGKSLPDRHAIEQNLDTVRFLGHEISAVRFPVKFTPWTEPVPPKAIGFAPCSKWKAKDWPLENFQALAHELGAGYTFYLLGGPQDAASCERLRKGIDAPTVNCCGNTDLLQLGGLLSKLALLVTNDSGPMHMAAAVETPTLALFGPTDPSRTGPYGEIHRTLRPERLAGQRLDFRSNDDSLMRELSVGEVVSAAREMTSD